MGPSAPSPSAASSSGASCPGSSSSGASCPAGSCSPSSFSTAPHSPPGRALVVGALGIAVLGIGVAAPLIRLVEAPALAVAFWRMTFSTAITASIWLGSGAVAGRRSGGHQGSRQGPHRRRSAPQEWALVALAGILLGIHFASWIQSLACTTVAASVVLVNTQPAFVAILAMLFLGEHATRREWAGVALAIAGAVVVSLGGSEEGGGSAPLLGALLALLGAVAAAGYYVVGRSLRRTMGLWSYVTRSYGMSAATLLALAAAFGTPLAPFPAATWAVFLALALGPSLLGHTILNWALRWLPATAVNVVVLGEPIVAAVLAAAIPAIGEVPGAQTLAGGATILAGIALVLWKPAGAPRTMGRSGDGNGNKSRDGNGDGDENGGAKGDPP